MVLGEPIFKHIRVFTIFSGKVKAMPYSYLYDLLLLYSVYYFQKRNVPSVIYLQLDAKQALTITQFKFSESYYKVMNL